MTLSERIAAARHPFVRVPFRGYYDRPGDTPRGCAHCGAAESGPMHTTEPSGTPGGTLSPFTRAALAGRLPAKEVGR